MNQHWIWQLVYLRIWSSCVSTAFTTRNESEGSVPANADCRACVKLSTSSMRTHTSAWGSSTYSCIFVNIFNTSFPLCKYSTLSYMQISCYTFRTSFKYSSWLPTTIEELCFTSNQVNVDQWCFTVICNRLYISLPCWSCFIIFIIFARAYHWI